MTLRRRLRTALASAAAVWWSCAAPGWAQTARPAGSQRIVSQWDFDRDNPILQPVPVGWFRAQDNPDAGRDRPGYPAWNVPILDREAAASGTTSLLLPTRGGSTSLMLAGGVVPAIPGTEYTVVASVRTDGLRAARARVSAWYLDQELRRIESSVTRSPAVNTQGRWEMIDASLLPEAKAAWIQVELELLQPEQLRAAPFGSFEAAPQDYAGSARFDDISILQVPRIELLTPAASNIVVDPEPPELIASVRDQAGEALTLHFQLFDMDGKELARQSMPMPGSGRRVRWKPALPGYGWYRAALLVTSPGGPLGARVVDFIYAPAPDAPPDVERAAFGLVAEGLSPAQRGALGPLIERTMTGAVSLSAWSAELTPETAEAHVRELSLVAEPLLDSGQELTFVLSGTPTPLAQAARADPDDPLPLFADATDPWRAYLGRVLATFGERVQRWQLGPTGGGDAFFDPRLNAEVEKAAEKLRRVIPRPMLTLPWRLEQATEAALTSQAGLTLAWPPGIGWSAIAGYAPSWPAGTSMRLVIEPLPASIYGRRAVAVDLARRSVSAWAAGAMRQSIARPWTTPQGPDQLMPSVELAVWRTLVQRLAGRRIVGQIDAGDGLTIHIAEGRDGNTLIGWSDAPTAQASTIRGYFGAGEIRVSDLFGNRRSLAPMSDGAHEVTLGESPVFIEGIDSKLAKFRAGLRFEPRFLPARASRHQVELVVENPWPVPLSGRLRLGEQKGWDITPRLIPLSIAPGGTARFPIEITFNLGEEAGVRELIAEVDAFAERRYPLLRLPLALEIGLPSIELVPTYRIEPSKDGASTDVVVTLMITNQSDAPATLECFAIAPGYKSLEAPVSGLAPGASITRRFRFEQGGTRLAGRGLRVGLREHDGSGRLNRTLIIEP